jgi:large conductance mechanosensitive channel
MGLMSEFKEFAVKGSVVDLAVGVVVGAAFGKIVTSMVNDIIMPLVGLLTGGTNFNDRWFALSKGTFDSIEKAHDAGMEAAAKGGVAMLKYGSFLQSVLDFVIVAFCIFIVIKQVNRLTKKPEPAKK